MAAKKKQIEPRAKCTMEIVVGKNDDLNEAVARKLTRPTVQAARTIQVWEPEHDVVALSNELATQVDSVNAGNMTRPEAMLLAQAHTLDELFNGLAKRSHAQTHMPNCEAYMRMALRAQNQCRMTLETLSNIKNPPVIFAKQANIASGHQQINIGVPATHTAENVNQPNGLLTELPHETLDSGRTSETIGVNSEMEAVGEVDRGANS